MALRNILQNDSFLRYKSREVTNYDKRLHLLLDDMIETLHSVKGAGLAAVQVGVLRRVCIVEVEEDECVELVNPVIVAQEGKQEGTEACLSVPEYYGYVERPMRVTVKAFDRNGNPFEVTGEGLKARALCHEIDHLDGKLYIDIASELVERKEGQEDAERDSGE